MAMRWESTVVEAQVGVNTTLSFFRNRVEGGDVVLVRTVGVLGPSVVLNTSPACRFRSRRFRPVSGLSAYLSCSASVHTAGSTDRQRTPQALYQPADTPLLLYAKESVVLDSILTYFAP